MDEKFRNTSEGDVTPVSDTNITEKFVVDAQATKGFQPDVREYRLIPRFFGKSFSSFADLKKSVEQKRKFALNQLNEEECLRQQFEVAFVNDAVKNALRINGRRDDGIVFKSFLQKRFANFTTKNTKPRTLERRNFVRRFCKLSSSISLESDDNTDDFEDQSSPQRKASSGVDKLLSEPPEPEKDIVPSSVETSHEPDVVGRVRESDNDVPIQNNVSDSVEDVTDVPMDESPAEDDQQPTEDLAAVGTSCEIHQSTSECDAPIERHPAEPERNRLPTVSAKETVVSEPQLQSASNCAEKDTEKSASDDSQLMVAGAVPKDIEASGFHSEDESGKVLDSSTAEVGQQEPTHSTPPDEPAISVADSAVNVSSTSTEVDNPEELPTPSDGDCVLQLENSAAEAETLSPDVAEYIVQPISSAESAISIESTVPQLPEILDDSAQTLAIPEPLTDDIVEPQARSASPVPVVSTSCETVIGDSEDNSEHSFEISTAESEKASGESTCAEADLVGLPSSSTSSPTKGSSVSVTSQHRAYTVSADHNYFATEPAWVEENLDDFQESETFEVASDSDTRCSNTPQTVTNSIEEETWSGVDELAQISIKQEVDMLEDFSLADEASFRGRVPKEEFLYDTENISVKKEPPSVMKMSKSPSVSSVASSDRDDADTGSTDEYLSQDSEEEEEEADKKSAVCEVVSTVSLACPNVSSAFDCDDLDRFLNEIDGDDVPSAPGTTVANPSSNTDRKTLKTPENPKKRGLLKNGQKRRKPHKPKLPKKKISSISDVPAMEGEPKPDHATEKHKQKLPKKQNSKAFEVPAKEGKLKPETAVEKTPENIVVPEDLKKDFENFVMPISRQKRKPGVGIETINLEAVDDSTTARITPYVSKKPKLVGPRKTKKSDGEIVNVSNNVYSPRKRERERSVSEDDLDPGTTGGHSSYTTFKIFPGASRGHSTYDLDPGTRGRLEVALPSEPSCSKSEEPKTSPGAEKLKGMPEIKLEKFVHVIHQPKDDSKFGVKNVGFVIYPGPGKPLNSLMKRHLVQLRWNKTEIDANWANFAVQTVFTESEISHQCQRMFVPATCNVLHTDEKIVEDFSKSQFYSDFPNHEKVEEVSEDVSDVVSELLRRSVITVQRSKKQNNGMTPVRTSKRQVRPRKPIELEEVPIRPARAIKKRSVQEKNEELPEVLPKGNKKRKVVDDSDVVELQSDFSEGQEAGPSNRTVRLPDLSPYREIGPRARISRDEMVTRALSTSIFKFSDFLAFEQSGGGRVFSIWTRKLREYYVRELIFVYFKNARIFISTKPLKFGVNLRAVVDIPEQLRAMFYVDNGGKSLLRVWGNCLEHFGHTHEGDEKNQLVLFARNTLLPPDSDASQKWLLLQRGKYNGIVLNGKTYRTRIEAIKVGDSLNLPSSNRKLIRVTTKFLLFGPFSHDEKSSVQLLHSDNGWIDCYAMLRAEWPMERSNDPTQVAQQIINHVLSGSYKVQGMWISSMENSAMQFVTSYSNDDSRGDGYFKLLNNTELPGFLKVITDPRKPPFCFVHVRGRKFAVPEDLDALGLLLGRLYSDSKEMGPLRWQAFPSHVQLESDRFNVPMVYKGISKLDSYSEILTIPNLTAAMKAGPDNNPLIDLLDVAHDYLIKPTASAERTLEELKVRCENHEYPPSKPRPAASAPAAAAAELPRQQPADIQPESVLKHHYLIKGNKITKRRASVPASALRPGTSKDDGEQPSTSKLAIIDDEPSTSTVARFDDQPSTSTAYTVGNTEGPYTSVNGTDAEEHIVPSTSTATRPKHLASSRLATFPFTRPITPPDTTLVATLPSARPNSTLLDTQLGIPSIQPTLDHTMATWPVPTMVSSKQELPAGNSQDQVNFAIVRSPENRELEEGEIDTVIFPIVSRPMDRGSNEESGNDNVYCIENRLDPDKVEDYIAEDRVFPTFEITLDQLNPTTAEPVLPTLPSPVFTTRSLLKSYQPQKTGASDLPVLRQTPKTIDITLQTPLKIVTKEEAKFVTPPTGKTFVSPSNVGKIRVSPNLYPSDVKPRLSPNSAIVDSNGQTSDGLVIRLSQSNIPRIQSVRSVPRIQTTVAADGTIRVLARPVTAKVAEPEIPRVLQKIPSKTTADSGGIFLAPKMSSSSESVLRVSPMKAPNVTANPDTSVLRAVPSILRASVSPDSKNPSVMRVSPHNVRKITSPDGRTIRIIRYPVSGDKRQQPVFQKLQKITVPRQKSAEYLPKETGESFSETTQKILRAASETSAGEDGKIHVSLPIPNSPRKEEPKPTTVPEIVSNVPFPSLKSSNAKVDTGKSPADLREQVHSEMMADPSKKWKLIEMKSTEKADVQKLKEVAKAEDVQETPRRKLVKILKKLPEGVVDAAGNRLNSNHRIVLVKPTTSMQQSRKRKSSGSSEEMRHPRTLLRATKKVAKPSSSGLSEPFKVNKTSLPLLLKKMSQGVSVYARPTAPNTSEDEDDPEEVAEVPTKDSEKPEFTVVHEFNVNDQPAEETEPDREALNELMDDSIIDSGLERTALLEKLLDEAERTIKSLTKQGLLSENGEEKRKLEKLLEETERKIQDLYDKDKFGLELSDSEVEETEDPNPEETRTLDEVSGEFRQMDTDSDKDVNDQTSSLTDHNLDSPEDLPSAGQETLEETKPDKDQSEGSPSEALAVDTDTDNEVEGQTSSLLTDHNSESPENLPSAQETNADKDQSEVSPSEGELVMYTDTDHEVEDETSSLVSLEDQSETLSAEQETEEPCEDPVSAASSGNPISEEEETDGQSQGALNDTEIPEDDAKQDVHDTREPLAEEAESSVNLNPEEKTEGQPQDSPNTAEQNMNDEEPQFETPAKEILKEWEGETHSDKVAEGSVPMDLDPSQHTGQDEIRNSTRSENNDEQNSDAISERVQSMDEDSRGTETSSGDTAKPLEFPQKRVSEGEEAPKKRRRVKITPRRSELLGLPKQPPPC